MGLNQNQRIKSNFICLFIYDTYFLSLFFGIFKKFYKFISVDRPNAKKHSAYPLCVLVFFATRIISFWKFFNKVLSLHCYHVNNIQIYNNFYISSKRLGIFGISAKSLQMPLWLSMADTVFTDNGGKFLAVSTRRADKRQLGFFFSS